MYYYIVLDGRKLPTPYATMREADDAIDELKAKIGACICQVIYE